MILKAWRSLDIADVPLSMRNFNTPHRTRLVDFPHPALQISSQNT